MNTVTPEYRRKSRRYRYHPGMTFQEMADQLGCSYQHLHLVVRGRRISHRLLARYRTLTKERAA